MEKINRSTAQQELEDVVSCLRESVPLLVKKSGVILAYLHGSTVTGLTHPWSDVDIALVVDESLTPAQQLRLMLRLNVDLTDACDLARPDCRVINAAPIMLRGSVVTRGILIYARSEEARVDFETNTRLRYFDYIPIQRAFQEASLSVIREKGLCFIEGQAAP
jgi:predicted nucleotidyltransferase